MKSKIIVLLGAALLLTTGCGSKTLTCTHKEEEGTIEITYKFNDKDVATKATMKATYEAESKEEAEEKKKAAEESFDDTSYYKNLRVKINGKKVTATVDLNLEEAEAEELQYNAVKEEMTEEGMTCK